MPSAPSHSRTRSALRSYLSLTIPLLVCTTLYLSASGPIPSSVASSLASPLASARAVWEGDVSLLGYKGASCPVQPSPLNVGVDWDPSADAAFRGLAADRLIGAVQIPTVSYDNMGPVGDEPRFEKLLELHDYLEKTYPGVYGKKEIELVKVNEYGLLYTWRGSKKGLKPIVLMAHQDVVPVNGQHI